MGLDVFWRHWNTAFALLAAYREVPAVRQMDVAAS